MRPANPRPAFQTLTNPPPAPSCAPFIQEVQLTLQDGRLAQDAVYEGGTHLTVKIWEGYRNERERGRPEWATIPLNQMPREWLHEMKTAVDDALKLAA